MERDALRAGALEARGPQGLPAAADLLSELVDEPRVNVFGEAEETEHLEQRFPEVPDQPNKIRLNTGQGKRLFGLDAVFQ